MDQNFHYNAIKVLATRAAFTADEANVLSYASQYTDHATEHKPIRVEGLPDVAYPQTVRDTFNPICTAHEALQYVTQWKSPDAQRKVYISFHFVPPKSYKREQPFDFSVSPNSPLARNLVTDAVDALKASSCESTERLRNLIRCGIALHSYADTWAHQGFSGRWSPTDNDVQDREVFEDKKWSRLPLFKRFVLDAAPDVGHAEVAEMPDQTDLRFKYRKASTSELVERDNATIFLDAAKHVYDLLRQYTGAVDQFDSFQNQLYECFRDSRKWSRHFGDVLKVGYNRMQWRREALDGERHDWDRMTTEADFATLSYKAKADLKWFLFHVEAGKHRDFVLRQISGSRL
jgi:hypothetical protein